MNNSKAKRVWQKVKLGQVLNLGELAIASGYDRGALARMALPLQAGKISLSDFRRIMQKRQDKQEGMPHAPSAPPQAAIPSGQVNGARSQQIDADRFFFEPRGARKPLKVERVIR